MNCFDKTLLQAYADHELDDQMVVAVDSHLQNCKKCADLLTEVNSGREQILDFLSQLNANADPISIPSPPARQQQQKAFSRKINTVQLLKAAAGIALLIGLFWIVRTGLSPQTIQMDEAELLFLEMISDTEPNSSWHDGQTLIVYKDEKGELIQSFANRN